jgi:hypothetical protein
LPLAAYCCEAADVRTGAKVRRGSPNSRTDSAQNLHS